MKDCLIGHTGFVGGNLDVQLRFEHRFNSRNIDGIRGGEFDTVYCAGVSAVKWAANAQPREDLLGIIKLIDAIRDISARRFVLVSTIDVYRVPVDVDEDTPVLTEGLHPYGLHRRMFETFVQERFPAHHIIRLPGLFGERLKKNIIYDFLHDNMVENVHADSVFQFYNLDGLADDIKKVVDGGIRLVNFATEPVSVKEVALRAFGFEFKNRPQTPPASYNMKTVYGSLFGSKSCYMAPKDEVLEDMRRFVARQKAGT